MFTYIEEIIGFLYNPATRTAEVKIPSRDKSVLFSMAKQLSNSISLTEKQAGLALKILKNNADELSFISGFRDLIENPRYKTPFRVIDSTKKIFFVDYEKEKYIAVKTLFDHKIQKSLSNLKIIKRISNNTSLYRISEQNIIKIVDNLKDFNFEIDNTVDNLYKELKEIEKNPERYVPCVSLENGVLEVKNSNQYVIDYFKNNQTNELLSDLFFARSMGLSFSKSIMPSINPNNKYIENMLFSGNNRFMISTEETAEIEDITSEIITSSRLYPVLVMLADDQNLQNTIKSWYASLSKNKVENSQISVLFRSSHNRDFNQSIKDLKLNNIVDEETKVVFISNKVPKLLYKIGVKPKMIISSSMYHAHYTSQKMVEIHPLVLYHTNHSRNNLGNNIAKL